jgi:hypothetical protein
LNGWKRTGLGSIMFSDTGHGPKMVVPEIKRQTNRMEIQRMGDGEIVDVNKYLE